MRLFKIFTFSGIIRFTGLMIFMFSFAYKLLTPVFYDMETIEGVLVNINANTITLFGIGIMVAGHIFKKTLDKTD